LNRRQAIWESLARPIDLEKQPLLVGVSEEIEWVDLPQQDLYEQVLQDYAQAGLSLKGHPMSFHRDWLQRQGARTCQELNTTSQIKVRIGGLVILRQRPGTAKGITFVTLEDETGQANLILHPDTWKKFYDVCRCSSFWMVRGKLQRQHDVVHLIVEDVQNIGAE